MTHGHKVRMIAVPVLLLTTALSGCAGATDKKQVASAGGDVKASAGADAPKDDAAQGRTFAKCMRDQGIDIPDPGADGMVAVPAMGAGDQAATKKMDAATEKCREFLPNGGEPPKMSAEDMAKAREYAKCVRENGLPDFPDPDPETGRFTMDSDKAAALDKLPKAAEKCQQFGGGVMPAIGGGE